MASCELMEGLMLSKTRPGRGNCLVCSKRFRPVGLAVLAGFIPLFAKDAKDGALRILNSWNFLVEVEDCGCLRCEVKGEGVCG
ncbi:hypothetical protein HDF13_002444 [Edaphobacter lichenicola]|uniref:Uncharacterized protein n=1 Tax=Tunturiibacter gelidiferens TaxID=3069689 RepID=A0ACC5NZT5_9BACT|nr:hypothetical protein [Edaphobacter lichenicola]